MLHTLALYVGWAVVGTCAVVGPLALLAWAWWQIVGRIIDHVWTLKVFYATCARILDERRAKDEGQLSRWPPRQRRR